jgi:hypothetical protein
MVRPNATNQGCVLIRPTDGNRHWISLESCRNGFAFMELRECGSNHCVQMFRGSARHSPGLSGLQAESPKPVPMCPDRLRIEVENHPDLVAGRDWVEATKLAEEPAASGEGISGLHTQVRNPPASRAAHSSSMSAVILGKWKRKRKCLILRQFSGCRTRISKRPMDRFLFCEYFFEF